MSSSTRPGTNPQYRQPRTPAQMAHPTMLATPVRPAGERDALLARAGPALAVEPDRGEAVRLWAAHVAAGRIGVPAPAPSEPPPPGCDYGFASLSRILASARRPWEAA